jgi:hypothetical protein
MLGLAAPTASAQLSPGWVERTFGSWQFISGARTIGGLRTIVCQVENLQRAKGWSFTLSRSSSETDLILQHQHLRLDIPRDTMINVSVGGERIRFQVERLVTPSDGPGGGIILTLVDDDTFATALWRARDIRLTLPGEGLLQWPARGGGEALAAMDTCPSLTPYPGGEAAMPPLGTAWLIPSVWPKPRDQS